MSSNYQPRRNSLNRSLQFEQSGDMSVNENDINQNYNSVHHNRFARMMHNNYNHNNQNAHKNSMSYDNHYATLDESVLNYTNNSKNGQGHSNGNYITPIKNIIFSKMNNFNNNNLTTSSNNNNNYIYNNNIVSLSLDQPKRNKPKKNNIKSSLTQAEKVYSGIPNNNAARVNPSNPVSTTSGTSKEKKSKLDIESLQNRILNEGARGYAVKDSFNSIVVNYAPNINQIIPSTRSSAKLSQNNIKNGLQSNGIPSSTRQTSNGNTNQYQHTNNVNVVKEVISSLNRSFQKAEADRATNLTMGSASKNSDNLNTTMTNNRCSSMMSFHEELPVSSQQSGYTNNLMNSADITGNILDNLMGNDIEIQNLKDKQNSNKGNQQGNQLFLKQNEIKYINSIKQKINQSDNNNQSVSARYQSTTATVASQSNQQQMQDQKSLYNVTKNTRYNELSASTGEQTSKSNNSIKSILTEKRKYKIDENSQISINNVNISYQQQNRCNPIMVTNTSSSHGQKFILKENNPNITLDSSLAVESQKINFDSYNVNSTCNTSQNQQSFTNNKASNNSLYKQQPSANNRYNHHVNLPHHQLYIGNSNNASTNNHTSKSINIVSRSNNFSTTNQNLQKNRDFTYDSIQYDQLPSQQQQYSFILNPQGAGQFNTISHNSGFGSSKGSTSGPKRKKIQINSKLLNNSNSNIGTFLNNNSTSAAAAAASSGLDSMQNSSILKQKTPESIIDRSGQSSQIQRVFKTVSSQISQNQNQNVLLLLKKVQECFNRFKNRQDQIQGQKMDKKEMEQIVNRYVHSNQNLSNGREKSKSPIKFSQSDRCTPSTGGLNVQKELLQSKQMAGEKFGGYQLKGNEEEGKSEINDRSTTLNSNNSSKMNNKPMLSGGQNSQKNIIKSISQTKQISNTQYKYHKIGFNILSRLFKKKYSYEFFIQLIKQQNQNHFSQ